MRPDKNKIIGYTTGVFDMFHVGHLRLLKRAKTKCDYLIVGVSSDELVSEYKGKLPIIPLQHRMEIVSSVEFVDEVIIQHNRDKLAAFHAVGFDVMFVGDDWKGDPLWVKLEEDLAPFGAKICYFKYTEDVSSTRFRELLQALQDEDKKI